MSNAVGKTEGGQFVPGFPSAEGLLEQLGLTGNGHAGGGWDGINRGHEALESPAQNERADLQRCFAQVYASPAGKRMIEAIVGKTLNCSPYMAKEEVTLEQQTAFGLQRQGQNGIAIWILSMIHAGQNAGPPKEAKKRKK